MDNQQVHTFFSYAYSVKNSPEEALTFMAHIPANAEVIVLQDSGKPQHPALKKAVAATGGKILRVRTSGPWNNVWRFIQQVEQARDEGNRYRDGASIWFVSLIPTAEIAAALKRHRAVAKLTNREEFFLKTLRFGEENDEVIAMTLGQDVGYLTDRNYKDLSIPEVFDLSAFEGQRFLRPVHDVRTCALIMSKAAA